MKQSNGGTVLLHEDGIYAVCMFQRKGRDYLAGASEQRGGGCSAVSLDPERTQERIWRNCGGTMKLCPDGTGGLFGIQNFFMGTPANDTQIVHSTFCNGAWQSATVVKKPCIHNLTVVQHTDGKSLVFATLCGARQDGSDWSRPGSVYAAEITEQGVREPRLILSGVTKNHGFIHVRHAESDAVYVSGSEGVFAIHAPSAVGGQWETEQLLAFEVSDLCLCDIDGDGVEEIGLYEGFHGDLFSVYDKTADGYTRVFSLPVTFGHPIYGGHGRMYAGSRKGDGSLYAITCQAGVYRADAVAEGLHASSLCEATWDAREGIVAACRNGDAVFFPF